VCSSKEVKGRRGSVRLVADAAAVLVVEVVPF
jgi:hypothetical protein